MGAGGAFNTFGDVASHFLLKVTSCIGGAGERVLCAHTLSSSNGGTERCQLALKS